MAGRVSDWYFMNGNSLAGLKEQIDEIRAYAAAAPGGGREVRFGANAFILAGTRRDPSYEGRQVRRE